MTWNLVYTEADTGVFDTFAPYFFDTYLASKPNFTVGPGSNAGRRVVTVTYPDVKGGDSSVYLWFSWIITGGTVLYQYENAKYTSVPGDSGDESTTNAFGSASSLVSGDFRIWESDEHSDAFLVTKGKRGELFWPGLGSGKWNLYRDQAWAAGDHNPNTCIGLGTGSVEEGLVASNAPYYTSDSTGEWRVFPGYTGAGGSVGHSNAYVFTGFTWNYNGDSATSGLSLTEITPCLPAVSNDQGIYVPAGSTVDNNAELDLHIAQLIQNTTDNKYYYFMGSNLVIPTYVLDFGLVEPDFS
jgi:hypothetical protein